MKSRFLVLLAVLALLITGCQIQKQEEIFSFARETSPEERQMRMQFVEAAESWLGTKGGSEKHRELLTVYNSHMPLAQGYAVKETDQWCATFVSAVAISCGITDIIPTECGCQRQIGLFMALDCWEEADDYIPLPGDIIYYSTENRAPGDCIQWSNHVGIVVGTSDSSIKVIEGNYYNAVGYHIIPIDDQTIRGFGLPNYS